MKKSRWLLVTLMLVVACILPIHKVSAQNTNDETFHYFAIGNSITQHPITSYWWGLWGMAATVPTQDYYHLVCSNLSKDGVSVSSNCIYYKDWESADPGSARSLQLSKLDQYLSSNLDLVTIQLGENVLNTSGLQADYETLINYVKAKAPHAQIIMIGDFWNNNTIDQMKINVCNEFGIPFINLASIQGNEYRVGSTVVTGADGQLHVITDEAVAAHPNNAAMKYIADQVLGTIDYKHLGGVDYSSVFDPNEYSQFNPDVASVYGSDKEGYLYHFVHNGMDEARRAKGSFSVLSYKDRYPDLQAAYGTNYVNYYMHYINSGKNEGRNGSVSAAYAVTKYNGVDYSAVYNFEYYLANNPDVANAFGGDDILTLKHFAENGVNEGRIANSDFNVTYYRNNYFDLQSAFGNNLKLYYLHYITNGRNEGRIANQDLNPNSYNGVDYSSVYDYDTYVKTYPDILNAFGGNKYLTIQHFVENGMREGRTASPNFILSVYKSNYADLVAAFGDDNVKYYMHYIQSGKGEGRIAK